MFNKRVEGVGKLGKGRWKQHSSYFAFNKVNVITLRNKKVINSSIHIFLIASFFCST